MAEENGKGKGDDKLDLGQLTEALKGLPEGVQNAVKDAIKEVSGDQQRAAAAAAAAAAKAAEADDDDDNDDPDFDVERVNNTELVNYIEKRITKTINKALKPISERLESTSTDAETDRVRREFQKAKDDFPDFMEWKDEMVPIINAHPELSAEDVYLLARAKNPDKRKEVDEKIGKGKEKKDGKEQLDKKKAFGGLLPTSGSSVEKDGKKNAKDAALGAWDEVMGQVDSSLLDSALEG